MRTIVTGGSGAIGRYVVRELLAHGHRPTIVDARPPRTGDESVGFIECDLTDREATLAAIRDCDAVCHLAAIPNPQNDPPERVLSVNVVSTFNVLEAARLNGVPRVVYACSESSSGFGIHNVELRPLYLPIDEDHPCWPHETYSLSKRFGEEMVQSYAVAYGIEGIALRYAWVWTERDAAAARAIVAAGLAGTVSPRPWFGAYIAPHDVAQGFRRSLEYRFPPEQAAPFEAFYLTAETTFLAEPTLDALRKHFDPLPEVRDADYFGADPFASVFDTRKARRLLGYRATRDWRTYDRWEEASPA